ncbi:MAG TPA: hypothetical protein VHZ51_03990 [Ktedonobacteraceae bacterium]|jgi:hypothetical protein|nr:hypothetical protein [Ktedonobacteraceae bacterium]
MMIQIYGFHWSIYAQRVMPAFSRWITEMDEEAVWQFYEQTRCAHEECILPPAMRRLQSWSRAQTFVHQLPRGPYTYHEYLKLCSAEQFTDLSDHYMYQHPPQLPKESDALRAVWGATIEEHCLAPFSFSSNDLSQQQAQEQTDAEERTTAPVRGELIDLLRQAGFSDLAQEVQQEERVATEPLEDNDDTQILHMQSSQQPAQEEFQEIDDEGITEASRDTGPRGVELGRYPASLHLRGWLAGISIRAMALFELLACGRRCMPFGYRIGEPFESFIGYLTPDEVWHLALCLRNVQGPARLDAEEQYRLFLQLQASQSDSFRMIDEIPPTHAHVFMKAVRTAASQGLGLICRVE